MADAPNNLGGSHDATGGFHDIKPLPQFSPFPWDMVWAGAGILALLLLFLIWKRRRGRAPAEIVVPPLSPLEAALEELVRLEQLRTNSRISLRDFSSRLSLALRTYLERTLSFPAAEQTASEVYRSLPEALRKVLPQHPPDRVTEYTSSIRTVLRFLEAAAFAHNSADKYHLESDEVRRSIPDIEALVRELEGHRKREVERTRSVMNSEAD